MARVCNLKSSSPTLNFRNQAFGSRSLDQTLKALGLGSSHAVAEFRQTIVTSPLVIKLRIWPLAGFFYQPVCQQALYRAVERPRPKPKLAVRVPLDLLHDVVAVTVTVRQRQQYVKRRRTQRQKLFRVSILFLQL